jgi:hypothetical protein
MKQFAVLSLAVILAVSAHAQKRQVVLVCTSDNEDPVGMRLCTELRDDLARSPRYHEASSNTTAAPHWTIYVASIPVNDSKTSSAQAVTITVGSTVDYYLSNYVLVTGRDRVASQAEFILAALDKQINE